MAAATRAEVFGGTPYSAVLGDVDGDGKLDVVVANRGSNSVSVLVNNGAGTLGAKLDYPTGRSPISVGLSDVDGDGKLDIVVANESTHIQGSYTVSVLMNRSPRCTMDL